MSTDEPEAYTIGDQPFLGLTIYLDSRPLIPRPETEWWTEQLLEKVRTSDVLTFLDLCAGSGAIGCAALKYLPDAQVYFGEIDPAHEATILKNVRENNLDASRAHVCIGNLFEPFGDRQFDIIAANPPYIPAGRKLPAGVANYEPHQALFSGPDGLGLIRRIATELPKHLALHGQAWIECDISNIEPAATLFQDRGCTVEIRNDQYGAPRVLVVSLSNG